MARIAARLGERIIAEKHVAAAKEALEHMIELRRQQEPFLPYLTGYVAFYLGDYQQALADLQRTDARDPFIPCLLGQTYEKLGEQEKALELPKAAQTGHNPPAAFAKPFARSKLGEAGTGISSKQIRGRLRSD
jgi:tetratricopeptide (TPR) repeat protein